MQIEQQPIERPVGQNKSMHQFSLMETNQIQLDMSLESGMDTMQWMDDNSARFREIIDEHPELVDLYHSDPVACKKIIQQELKKKVTLH